MKDEKLWTVFSEYIRRRDSDENGIATCFTCGLKKRWREMDCGHGIPRQHKATKFHEKNNHAQCKKCNGFEEGEQYKYALNVDKKYGPGTWDELVRLSRTTLKRTQAEIDELTNYYKNKLNGKDL